MPDAIDDLRNPTTPVSADPGPRTCSVCGHLREGIPAPERQNQRRLRAGKPLLLPACSTGYDQGFGDVDECGCTDPAHSERLVDQYRTA